MNEELANFLVTFTTTGLAEVNAGIEELSEKMDGLASGSGGAKSGVDGLLGSLWPLLGALGLVTSALAAVGLAVSNAFNVGNAAIDLKNLSDITGVSSEKLETMGIVLKKYGGDVNDAAETYRNIDDMMNKYSQGKIPEDDLEMIGRYGRYGLNIREGMSADEVLQNLNDTFVTLKDLGEEAKIREIAGVYGIGDATTLMLMQSIDALTEEARIARTQLVISNEEVQKNAEELRLAKVQLKAVWDKLGADLIPVLSQLIEILTPILEVISVVLAPILQVIIDAINWLRDRLTPVSDEEVRATYGDKTEIFGYDPDDIMYDMVTNEYKIKDDYTLDDIQRIRDTKTPNKSLSTYLDTLESSIKFDEMMAALARNIGAAGMLPSGGDSFSSGDSNVNLTANVYTTANPNDGMAIGRDFNASVSPMVTGAMTAMGVK